MLCWRTGVRRHCSRSSPRSERRIFGLCKKCLLHRRHQKMHQMLRFRLSTGLLGSPSRPDGHVSSAHARSQELAAIRLHHARTSLHKATKAPQDELRAWEFPITKGILRPAVLADRSPPSTSARWQASAGGGGGGDRTLPQAAAERREQQPREPQRRHGGAGAPCSRPRSAPAAGRCRRPAARRSCALSPEEAGHLQQQTVLPAYGSYFDVNHNPGPASSPAPGCNARGDLLGLGARRRGRPGVDRPPSGTWSAARHAGAEDKPPVAQTANFDQFGSTGRSGFQDALATPGPAGGVPPLRHQQQQHHQRRRQQRRRPKPPVFGKSRRW